MAVRIHSSLSNELHEKFDKENEDDRLTSLPEGVRTYILSLLPTPDSVRTCILSKKWEKVWKYVNSLYFDDKLDYTHIGRRVHFIHFVYRVLLESECKHLNAFHLSCTKGVHAQHVETWVSTAVKREVKYLTMNYDNENMVLPQCFLACKSFRELEIEGPMTLKITPLIYFPNLTTLYLTRIKFENGRVSNSNEELVLNFPALKVFHVSNCIWYHVKSMKLYTSAALAEFAVSWSYYNCECCGTKDFKIEIFGSSSFVTRGLMLENVLFSRPELVVEAEFGQRLDYRIQANLDLIRKASKRVLTNLGIFSNLMGLKISSDIIEATNREEPSFSYPLLDKVKQLLVYSGFQKITWCGALMKLLKSLPNLWNLQLNVHGDDWNVDSNEDGTFETPNCISSSIELVRFEYFGASTSELRLLKVFLENGLALKHIAIVTSLSNKALLDDELLLVQRASVDAEVTVDYLKFKRRKRKA